ncbi:hypothetical protein PYW07_008626 [Mythimna separata]|uniref:Coiled-coil domain-containing protein 86 n=1 Tax=Mythimna separata TaxID=271217 RepID=A0AAD7YD14_MYTSE|nr:hypothetical protein PYW07_008626 [Mythimna separata]
MAEETQNKVLEIVANITQSQYKVEKAESNDDEDNSEQETKSLTKIEPIRGIPKSGKFWKSKKEKFSTINKTKGLRYSFEKKEELRRKMQKTRELSKQMIAELKQKELDRKERRRQNLQRAEENKRKAEVVQVITNTAKLKRMRKKQLRFIEKRDVSKEVPANK